MKTNIINDNSRTSSEDNAFLARIKSPASLSQLLIAAPSRFLSASLEEVDLPTRFVNRMKAENVKTLVDLLKFDEASLKGRNLGTRTLEVANEALAKFFVKKISQKPLVSLREMMEDFSSDLLARESRIWEMRTGLKKERYTLEAIGEKFGLTRERVRQIESALFTQFSKKYPALDSIETHAQEGTQLSEFVRNTGALIDPKDTLPLAALLECLDPKMYLVADVGNEPVITSLARSELETTYRQTVNIAEKIFRQSEVQLTRAEFVKALDAVEKDDTAKMMALDAVDIGGVWVDGLLLSPNDDRVNVAVGCIQASPTPLSLEKLVEEIKELCKEDTTPEALRSAFSFIPSIRSFGFGLVGFSRHVDIKPELASDIIRYVEGVVSRGKEGYQWNTKDFLARLIARNPDFNLGHHELNVILQNSSKLAYLGRLTWVLKGEHNPERKFYKDIFSSILDKAGKPLPEEILVERAQRQRGLHLNVHLRNDSHFIEVLPHVWGLTERDQPFSKREITAFTKLFDSTFHTRKEFDQTLFDKKGLNSRGLKPSEIMKVIELKGE